MRLASKQPRPLSFVFVAFLWSEFLPVVGARRGDGANVLHLISEPPKGRQSLLHVDDYTQNLGDRLFKRKEHRSRFVDYNAMLTPVGPCRYAAVGIMLVWAALLTWMLVTTADTFFCPPLKYWARKLRLQPEVAGATLLAFGNGAPDVFTAQAAANASDVPLLLGEMLGANCFLTCIVMGSVILVSWEGATTVPKKGPFLYNALWYMGAVLTCCLILLDGTISVVEAVILLASYVVYVVTLCIWTPRSPCEEAATETKASMMEAAQSTDKVDNPPSLEGVTPPKDGSAMDWIVFGVQWPFYMIRWATIPPADDVWDRQRRVLCSLTPVGIVALFFLVIDSHFNLSTYCLFVSVGALLGMMIFSMCGDGPETPWIYPLFTFIAKVSSCIWLAFLAAELTDVVKALGLALGIPTALLGITVVAWGNSLGDLLACLAVSRAGDMRMAIVGIFSSPLFSNLVGFGLSALATAAAHGGRAVIFNPHDMSSSFKTIMPLVGALVCAVISAVMCCTAFHKQNYKAMPNRYWAYGLFACYSIFIVSEGTDYAVHSAFGSSR